MQAILAGAGIGGLTAALALAARDVGTTVVEQAETLAEAGAGLQLSPNATRRLFALGLERALGDVAVEPAAVEILDHASGARLHRTELGEAARRRWGAPYLLVHRADLQGVLADAARKDGRIRLRLGARLISASEDRDGVTAALATGDGDERLRADALIGCDGIRSTVRAMLWGERPARFTGQTAWRGLVDARRLDRAAAAPVVRVWTGPGRHFVHYPVRGGRLVNFVGVVAHRDWTSESWTEPGDLAALAGDFAGWPAPVGELIAAADETWRFALHDRPALARWSRGRISLLGDAAHPVPPFLAQGAAMAVEDADALAARLAGAASVADALAGYAADRQAHTAQVGAWSRRNARFFHLPGPLARGLFAAADGLDRLGAGGPAARLDWLYGPAARP